MEENNTKTTEDLDAYFQKREEEIQKIEFSIDRNKEKNKLEEEYKAAGYKKIVIGLASPRGLYQSIKWYNPQKENEETARVRITKELEKTIEEKEFFPISIKKMETTAEKDPDNLFDTIKGEMGKWEERISQSSPQEQEKIINSLVELAALDKSGLATKYITQNILRCSKKPHNRDEAIYTLISTAKNDRQLASIISGIKEGSNTDNNKWNLSPLMDCLDNPNFGVQSMEVLSSALLSENIAGWEDRKIINHALKEKFLTVKGKLPERAQSRIDYMLQRFDELEQKHAKKEEERKKGSQERPFNEMGHAKEKEKEEETQQNETPAKKTLGQKIYNFAKQTAKYAGKAALYVINLPYTMGNEISKKLKEALQPASVRQQHYEEIRRNRKERKAKKINLKNQDFFKDLRNGKNVNLEEKNEKTTFARKTEHNKDTAKAYFEVWSKKDYTH